MQLLDEENKELRLLLRGKYQGSDGCVISPLQTKVSKAVPFPAIFSMIQFENYEYGFL